MSQQIMKNKPLTNNTFIIVGNDFNRLTQVISNNVQKSHKMVGTLPLLNCERMCFAFFATNLLHTATVSLQLLNCNEWLPRSALHRIVHNYEINCKFTLKKITTKESLGYAERRKVASLCTDYVRKLYLESINLYRHSHAAFILERKRKRNVASDVAP